MRCIPRVSQGGTVVGALEIPDRLARRLRQDTGLLPKIERATGVPRRLAWFFSGLE